MTTTKKTIPNLSNYDIYFDGRIWSKERLIAARKGGKPVTNYGGFWMEGEQCEEKLNFNRIKFRNDQGEQVTMSRQKAVYMAFFPELYRAGVKIRFRDGNRKNCCADNLFQLLPDSEGVYSVGTNRRRAVIKSFGHGKYRAVLIRGRHQYLGPERTTTDEAMSDFWDARGNRKLPEGFEDVRGKKVDVWRVSKKTLNMDKVSNVVVNKRAVHFGDGTWNLLDNRKFAFFDTEGKAKEYVCEQLKAIIDTDAAILAEKRLLLKKLTKELQK